MRFVKDARDRMEWGPPGPPPLLVKIAPDLTEEDKVRCYSRLRALGFLGGVLTVRCKLKHLHHCPPYTLPFASYTAGRHRGRRVINTHRRPRGVKHHHRAPG